MVTCQNTDQITLEVPSAGVEVRPIESDIREQRRHYTRAEFTLTEEAGALVDEQAPEASRIFINIDGVPSRRMYLPPDSISFENSLEDTTVAKISVLDGRQVLRRGSIEKSFNDTTVGDVVDYIIGQRDDPDNVIQGYEFINESTSSVERNLSAAPSFLPRELQELNVAAGQHIDNLYGTNFDSDDEYAGFDFSGISPVEAMERAMEEFQINWWVEDDGIVYIGPDGTRGQMVSTSAYSDNIVMSRYTVTEKASKTNAVQIVGPVNLDTYADPLALHAPTRSEGTGLRTIAEATATNLNGSLLIKEGVRDIHDPRKLEAVAKLSLYQEVMDDFSGSIEINGLASEDSAALRDMSVGDYILTDPTIREECKENVITGLFMITGVQHVADDRRGWRITIEVGRIPRLGSVETGSVFYDPETDKEYDTLRAYEQEQEEQEEEDDGGFADTFFNFII